MFLLGESLYFATVVPFDTLALLTFSHLQTELGRKEDFGEVILKECNFILKECSYPRKDKIRRGEIIYTYKRLRDMSKKSLIFSCIQTRTSLQVTQVGSSRFKR